MSMNSIFIHLNLIEPNIDPHLAQHCRTSLVYPPLIQWEVPKWLYTCIEHDQTQRTAKSTAIIHYTIHQSHQTLWPPPEGKVGVRGHNDRGGWIKPVPTTATGTTFAPDVYSSGLIQTQGMPTLSPTSLVHYSISNEVWIHALLWGL